MPEYKVVNATQLDHALAQTAAAIRAKTKSEERIPWDENAGFAAAVEAISAGSAESVPMKEVNFYDYDGTRLYSYTVAEAAALTELPPLPTQPGLTCQGWNWTLEDIKAMDRAVDVGATYITDDGKTRIYITLLEGRTSPMLGCCPNGTVTVDWGDGTEPDILTGTSTLKVQWTPNHEYAAPGDYVITLIVDGTMEFYGSTTTEQYSGLLRYASGADTRNYAYLHAIRRIEIGGAVTSIENYAFYGCSALTSIVISDSVTSIGNSAFINCSTLTSIVIPDSVTSIDNNAFYGCSALRSVAIPDSVTSIGGSAFKGCSILTSVVIPDSVTSIGGSVVYGCSTLTSIVIPNSVTSIGSYVFQSCVSMRFCDFTSHSSVPTLSNKNAFTNISTDCEIRVPAALADEWKTATNWAEYADHIVGV